MYLYSSADSLEQATYVGIIGPDELVELRREHMVACDPLDQTAYHEFHKYALPGRRLEKPRRVFYTTSPLMLRVAGVHQFALHPATKRAAKDMLGNDGLHKHFAVTPSDGQPYFSFHVLYNRETREWAKKGTFLHSPEGEILAAKIEDVGGILCDGCAIPSYDDPVEWLFRVVNVFSFEEFPYPVAFLDTSTVEGRSIKLATLQKVTS